MNRHAGAACSSLVPPCLACRGHAAQRLAITEVGDCRGHGRQAAGSATCHTPSCHSHHASGQPPSRPRPSPAAQPSLFGLRVCLTVTELAAPTGTAQPSPAHSRSCPGRGRPSRPGHRTGTAAPASTHRPGGTTQSLGSWRRRATPGGESGQQKEESEQRGGRRVSCEGLPWCCTRIVSLHPPRARPSRCAHPAGVVIVFNVLHEDVLAQALQIGGVVCPGGWGGGGKELTVVGQEGGRGHRGLHFLIARGPARQGRSLPWRRRPAVVSGAVIRSIW